MHYVNYIALCFAPIIFIAMYFYFRNHREKEFMRLMLRSFVAGAMGVSVLILAFAISFELGISELKSLKRILFFAFVTSAGASELGKFIVYRYFIMRTNKEISPIDSILLSITTALGFSALALLLIVLNIYNVQEYRPVTLFTLSYIPANLIFSVVMGFFIGMARFLQTHIVFSLTGLTGAILFHGIYNFCLFTHDFRLLSLFAFGSTVIVFILAMKAAFTVPDKSY
jgi:RsiW-degrading membrane proteinase PrsW (M82 family)